MKKFDVHLFPVVRVKVSGVEAADELAAIKRAEGELDLNKLFNQAGQYLANWLGCNRLEDGSYAHRLDVEYAEEVSHFLVDPKPALAPGDAEGVWYGPGYERDDPNPSGTKAGMFDKIIACKKLLPTLLGIDPELDKLIAKELES